MRRNPVIQMYTPRVIVGAAVLLTILIALLMVGAAYASWYSHQLLEIRFQLSSVEALVLAFAVMIMAGMLLLMMRRKQTAIRKFGEALRATDDHDADITPTHGSPAITRVAPQLNDLLAEKAALQKALLDSELRFTSILEVAQEAIICVDAQQHVIIFNKMAEHMFGYAAAEVIGGPIDLFMPPAFRSAHDKQFNSFTEDGGLFRHSEITGLRKSGESFPAEVSVSRLNGGSGMIFVVLLRDITERKRQEQEIKASAAFSRAVLGSLSAHIAVLDPAGNIVVTNQAWDRFSRENGITDMTLTGVGANYLDVCRHATGYQRETALEVANGIEAVSSGKVAEYVVQYACSSPAEERWFLMRATPLTGSPGSVVVSHANISESRRTQQLLSEAYEKLETRVLERTVALEEANSRLRTEMIQNQTAIDLIQNYADEIYDLYNNAPCGYHSLDKRGVIVQMNDTELDWLGYQRDEVIGRMKFTDVVVESSVKIFPDEFGLLMQNGTVSDLQYEMRRKDGSTFPILLNATAVKDGLGNFTRSRATVFDLSKRLQIEAAEREQRTLAESLRDSATVLSSSLNIDEVLDHIMANAARVVEHAIANVSLIEDGYMRLVRSYGYSETEMAGFAESVNIQDSPALLHMMESREPTIMVDRNTQPELTILPFLSRMRSFVSVPICLDGEVIGLLTLHDVEPGYFTPIHAERMRIFANQAAIALRNARLYEQAQTLAALEERQRLARDLHDAVSQTLWSASLIADVLPTLWDRDPANGHQKLQRLRQLQRDAHLEMRALLLELRPLDSVNSGLDELLQRLRDAFIARTGKDIILTMDGKCTLPPNVQVSLYRIAQESLNNILRHAEATKIELRLYCNDNSVHLRVKDNGIGFDPARVTETHLGLNIMRERAAKIGMQFEVNSKIGSGTEIVVQWTKPTHKS